MTINDILGMSPDELKKLSDEEFMREFGYKYKHITRPELAQKPTNIKRKLGDNKPLKQLKIDFVQQMAKSMGIDLGDFD